MLGTGLEGAKNHVLTCLENKRVLRGLRDIELFVTKKLRERGDWSIWRSFSKVVNKPNVSDSKARQVLSFQFLIGNV